MLDSAIKVNRMYYPEILLGECKYEMKKPNIENLINDNLEQSSSHDESDNKSENEPDNAS